LGEGVADAMDRIADYYLRLADKIFPVLEIDAGRKVDIVITQSASIKRVEP
jgi:conjugal transfer pilus assembly protein TraB